MSSFIKSAFRGRNNSRAVYANYHDLSILASKLCALCGCKVYAVQLQGELQLEIVQAMLEYTRKFAVEPFSSALQNGCGFGAAALTTELNFALWMPRRNSGIKPLRITSCKGCFFQNVAFGYADSLLTKGIDVTIKPDKGCELFGPTERKNNTDQRVDAIL